MRPGFRAPLLSLLLGLAATPAVARGLAPFSADYDVYLDGKLAGRSTIELRQAADARWTLRVVAEGTRGLARIAGFESEQSALLEADGAGVRLLSARMSTRSLLRDRAYQVDFDWASRTLRWQGDVDDDQRGPAPFAGEPATGASLNLQLALRATDADDIDAVFESYDRGKGSEVRYRHGARETIEVPYGRYPAVPMRRERTDKARVTTAWYADGLAPTPLRVLQTEHGEARYELRLRQLRGDPPAP